MSRKLSRLNLKPSVLGRLEKQNLHTCKDVLSLTKFEVMNILGLNIKEVEELIRTVCLASAPNPITALDIYNVKKKTSDNGFIPTSLLALDTALSGGLPLGSITEIVGPPSVGKTQFCMLLCLVTALPKSMQGLNHAVVYIDTESSFMAKRLKAMAASRCPNPKLHSAKAEICSLMENNILVYRPATLSEAKKIILGLEFDIIRNKVKLIIIDSMASLLRNEFRSKRKASIVNRNNMIEYVAALKNLAETFGVSVFVTNHITTKVVDVENSLLPLKRKEIKFNSNISENSTVPLNNENQVIPTLGSIWAHCCNTRLMARFVSSSTRQLIIAKSPLAANVAVQYVITQSGIELTSKDIEEMNYFHLHNLSLFTKCDFPFSEENICPDLYFA